MMMMSDARDRSFSPQPSPPASRPSSSPATSRSRIDFELPDGGLAAYPGVANIQVFRAARGDDGKGWTYHHHVDLACWKGRLYLAWDTCEKDEDVWPSRELYATSADGVAWSEPAELFPQGLSTHLRMYFFRAPNGRMLAIAGLRASQRAADRAQEGRADRPRDSSAIIRSAPCTCCARRPSRQARSRRRPSDDSAGRWQFVEACKQLLANKPFLEQSDYGYAPRRSADEVARRRAPGPPTSPRASDFNRFGKAMAFYHRKDGALVAVMKWGWVLVSRDEGETWSPPVRPPTFVSGMAKAWRPAHAATAATRSPTTRTCRTASRSSSCTGDDGITFGDMRVVHGELPPIRYPGLYKVARPAIRPRHLRMVQRRLARRRRRRCGSRTA